MSRHPFEIEVACECGVERISMGAADPIGIARAIVAAQAVGEALCGHPVDVGFRLASGAGTGTALDTPTWLRKIA